MTYQEAVDAILAVFHNVWVQTGHYVTWDDKGGQPEDATQPWARAVLRHTLGGQGSLAGGTGLKLWDRGGTLFVQIFTPVGSGNSAGYTLGQPIVDAYQAERSSVMYRNAKLQEAGRDGAFQMVLFTVDFVYTDVR